MSDIDDKICNHPKSPEYSLATEISDEGVRLYTLGKVAEALQKYKRAIELHPTLQSAHYNIAMIMMEHGKIEEALHSFERVNEILDSDMDCTCIDKATFHANFGAALYRAKRLEKAVKELELAIELNPQLPEPYLCAGHIFFDNEMYDKSILFYEEYSKTRSQDEIVRMRMGAAYEIIGLFDKAIENFRILCSLNNSEYNNHILGVLFYKNNELDNAISSYIKCIEINPNYYEAYYSLANVMRDRGLFSEAILNYKKALAINENEGKIHCNLGNVYCRLNMEDEAIIEFSEAIRCDNNDMIAIRGLAALISKDLV